MLAAEGVKKRLLMGAWRRRELTVERRKAERTVEEVDMVGRGVWWGLSEAMEMIQQLPCN
jgi:hypothetical protein